MNENGEQAGWLCRVETDADARQPFCAGLVVLDGVVDHAAPILRWTVGKPARDCVRQLRARGWQVDIYPCTVRPVSDPADQKPCA